MVVNVGRNKGVVELTGFSNKRMCGLLLGPQKSGRNNEVVGLTGFSNKRMCGLLFGPQKISCNKGVVVLTGWSYGGVHCLLLLLIHLYSQRERK